MNGFGLFLIFIFFCPEEFHKALPGCAKKNSSQATFAFKNNHGEKVVNAKSFILFFLSSKIRFPHLPLAIQQMPSCHLSWSLLINKETVS